MRPDEDVPFGREELFERLASLLDQGGPQLALIEGPRASGRSALLRALAMTAADRGFDVVADRDALLGFEVDTAVEAVAERIREGAPDADAAASSSSAAGDGVLGQARRWLRSMSGSQESAALIRRAPVLMPIDGYRPGPRLSVWFTLLARSLLSASERAGATAVIVIADEPEALQPLAALATTRHELGALDPARVRALLVQAGAGLEPALGSDEVDVYVERAKQDPSMLEALTSLFRFAGAAAARR